ncbi:hypothetical protein FA15DRAFT_578353, partial [Coprinopsis marcescibilis]
PPLAAPVPRKPAHRSPLLRTASVSTSPPSTASTASLSPASSSSSSPDYYDSPPSPPLTLEDQVHVAYAHDDIHTAKILLLRLKGIEVTDDDDPRIAEVQDEDFDFCFAPNGGLVMDAQDEKRIKDHQRIDLERMERHRRQERLRMCEIKWENEKRRMREERMAVLRYREAKRQEEEDSRRRRRVEQDRARLAEEERRKQQAEQDMFQRHTRARSRSERRGVNYSSLHRPSTSSSVLSWGLDADNTSSFVYDFMTPPVRRQQSSRRSPESALPNRSRSHNDIQSGTRHPSHHPNQQPLVEFDDSHSVPFTDVLKSMQGALFPVTHEERRARARRKESPSPSHSRPRTLSQSRRIRENDLIHILLDTVEEGSNAKGKANPIISRPRRRSTGMALCTACKQSPLSSAASSAGSRLSWLSFRSSSSLATTPSDAPSPSPRSSWFKATDSRRSSWIAPSSPSSTTEESEPCRCHQMQLTPIDINDSPLTSPLLLSKSPAKSSAYTTTIKHRRRRTVSAPSSAIVTSVSLTVSHGVHQLVELARGFQQAYVTAAMFSVVASIDGESWDERQFFYEVDQNGVRCVKGYVAASERKDEGFVGGQKKMKPQGHRVSSKDLAVFLAVDGEVDGKRRASVVTKAPSPAASVDIPLSSPYGATQPMPPPRRTVLTAPRELVFKPCPAPSRSPFRFNALSHLHTTYPVSAEGAKESGDGCATTSDGSLQVPTWRIRSVGNPVHMRLKALHSLCWKDGIPWKGRGREMGLGGGHERIVGVAYENIGQSHLAKSCA